MKSSMIIIYNCKLSQLLVIQAEVIISTPVVTRVRVIVSTLAVTRVKVIVSTPAVTRVRVLIHVITGIILVHLCEEES